MLNDYPLSHHNLTDWKLCGPQSNWDWAELCLISRKQSANVIQGVFAFNQQVLLDERILSVMFRRKLRTLGKSLKENSLQTKEGIKKEIKPGKLNGMKWKGR